MRFVRSMIVLSVFCASAAYAVDPQLSDITCEQLGEQYEATPEATERFADLKGTCDGVYEVNGALYVRAQAVVRRANGSRVRLYMPATDHTFDLDADPSGRVHLGNSKIRVRDLNRGDEIGLYLSVDKFATERITEVALATEDAAPEEIVVTPVETVVALPTTG